MTRRDTPQDTNPKWKSDDECSANAPDPRIAKANSKHTFERGRQRGEAITPGSRVAKASSGYKPPRNAGGGRSGARRNRESGGDMGVQPPLIGAVAEAKSRRDGTQGRERLSRGRTKDDRSQ